MAFSLERTQFNEQIERVIKNNIPEDVPKGWMIEFKCRNNSKYNKVYVQNMIAPLMKKHFIEYKLPDYVINVEIMQKLVGLSVLKNYFLYKKYSLKTSSQMTEVQESIQQKKVAQQAEKQPEKEETQETPQTNGQD